MARVWIEVYEKEDNGLFRQVLGNTLGQGRTHYTTLRGFHTRQIMRDNTIYSKLLDSGYKVVAYLVPDGYEYKDWSRLQKMSFYVGNIGRN